MNDEEKKAIKLLEDIKNNSWTTKYIMSSDSKNADILLNLITKLQKENKELRKGQNSLMQSRKKWKDRYYKLKAKSKKIIDLMAENIELQQYANIDTTDIDLICKRLHCNKKCRLVSKECIKKYFTRIIRG